MYSRTVVVRFIVSIIDNDIIMVSGVLFTALNDVETNVRKYRPTLSRLEKIYRRDNRQSKDNKM